MVPHPSRLRLGRPGRRRLLARRRDGPDPTDAHGRHRARARPDRPISPREGRHGPDRRRGRRAHRGVERRRRRPGRGRARLAPLRPRPLRRPRRLRDRPHRRRPRARPRSADRRGGARRPGGRPAALPAPAQGRARRSARRAGRRRRDAGGVGMNDGIKDAPGASGLTPSGDPPTDEAGGPRTPGGATSYPST
ncbi:hypothetical protein [Ornithinimicrobium kibberense]|uniref:hypothetical protein n=1 Tax=Ornithinimicrobium kibberense TaxID=282060 RepID=UPI0036124D4C